MNGAAVAMEITGIVGEALAVLDRCKEETSRFMASDLGAAAVLLESVAVAAGYMVRVNAEELSDERMRERVHAELTTTLGKARRHRESIESYVRAQMG
jgi:formiminotetrahydrofolate cyclodeaminase